MRSVHITIISFLMFISGYSQASFDLSALKNSLIEKYKVEKFNRINSVRINKVSGGEIYRDSVLILLYKESNVKLKNQMIISINGNILIYSGDSLHTLYKNGELLSNKINKGNYSFLELQNIGNPYYKPKNFFNKVNYCTEIFNFDSLGLPMIRLVYKHVNKGVENRETFTINIADTSLVGFSTYSFSKSLSYSVYYSFSYFFECNQSSYLSFLSQKDLLFENSIRTDKESKMKIKLNSLYPNNKLINLNSDTLTLLDFGQGYYLIDLWYIGCKPCMEATTSIIEIATRYPSLNVVGLNTMNSNLKDLEKYKNKLNIVYDLLYDPKIEKDYHIIYPTFVVLDKELSILFIVEGFSKNNMKELNEFISTLYN